MNKLVVNVGGMFSGKTTALIQQGERFLLSKKRVLYVKPEIDNRYSDSEISTHKGVVVEAMVMPIEGLGIDISNYDVVLIDEVQFFKNQIIKDIENLLEEGITVIVSGLDMDFKGEGFEVTKELMARADKVIKHKAVCELCGEDATFSYRKTNSKELVFLGEKDSYLPLCRKCFAKNYRKDRGE